MKREEMLAQAAGIICGASCGLVSECRSREAAAALFEAGLLRASAAPEEGIAAVPPVERIEMVDYASGYGMEAEPEWRVQVSGVCADFQTETAANNFRNAILALPSGSGKAAPVAWRVAMQQIRRYCDENLGPSRSSLLNKIAALADAALAPATEGGGREPSIWLLAGRLAGAELNYRNAYEQLGGSHRETGRAWDKLRQAGNAIREISDSVWEAALSPSPSVGTSAQPSAQREAPPPAWLGDEGGGP